METLNLDCLYEICEKLELEDQVSFGNAWEGVRSELTKFWCLHYKEIDFRKLKNIQFNENYKFFFVSIANTVNNFYFCAEQVKSLKDYFRNFEFPIVETIGIDFLEVELKISDNFMLEMTNRCPNVRNLTARNNVTGKHIWKWKNLRALKLYILRDAINFRYTERIFNTLPLTKLFFTKLLSGRLHMAYTTILNEAMLQIYRCRTLEDLTLDALCFRTPIIESLRTNLRRLRVLQILNGYAGEFEFDHVNRVFNSTVIELFYTLCEPEDKLLTILSHLPNVRTLHVEFFYRFRKDDNEFLNEIIKIIGRQQTTEHRDIYCYGKRLNESDLRLMNLPENVTFHTRANQRGPVDDFGLRFILRVEE